MDKYNSEEAVSETVRNLVRLIQFDTSNPPGNELPAILAIKEILECEGIPSEEIKILEPAPGRANLVVRLKGDGSRRPLLLSGHVDVVPVEREYWSHDPFGGEIADGCIWGRGTLDMKGFLAMYLQTFMMIRRSKITLKRDLILAAVADEEALFPYGSKYLVDNHRELIDAEYGFTETGAMTVHMGPIRLYPIQVAEKKVWSFIMRARGEAGHAGIPNPDNAVMKIAEAIYKIKRAGNLPVHITPNFSSMMHAIGEKKGFPVSLFTSLMSTPWGASAILRLTHGAVKDNFIGLLTNSCRPTVLRAGKQDLVVPTEAEAVLSCRILPGQTVEDLYRELKAITGDQVEFDLMPTVSTAGAQFSTDTDMFHRLVKATQKMDPGGVVSPYTLLVATDASEYQRAGITVYGFCPGILPPDIPISKLVHNHNERIPISFIESGLPALWDVVTESCAG